MRDCDWSITSETTKVSRGSSDHKHWGPVLQFEVIKRSLEKLLQEGGMLFFCLFKHSTLIARTVLRAGLYIFNKALVFVQHQLYSLNSHPKARKKTTNKYANIKADVLFYPNHSALHSGKQPFLTNSGQKKQQLTGHLVQLPDRPGLSHIAHLPISYQDHFSLYGGKVWVQQPWHRTPGLTLGAQTKHASPPEGKKCSFSMEEDTYICPMPSYGTRSAGSAHWAAFSPSGLHCNSHKWTKTGQVPFPLDHSYTHQLLWHDRTALSLILQTRKQSQDV